MIALPALPEALTRLLPGDGQELLPYFAGLDGLDPRLPPGRSRRPEDWLALYRRTARSGSFLHGEPWVTLASLYALFGDQRDLDGVAREVANLLMAVVYRGRAVPAEPPQFGRLAGVRVEVPLPENKPFQRYLRQRVFASRAWHPYADRCHVIKQKMEHPGASLEGSTNLDALITGTGGDGRPVHVFIEAKFLSDTSKDISYLPVRNQIARNLDCAIDLVTRQGSDLDGLHDFWFVLLTPGMFRTPSYGGPCGSPIDAFAPWRSRLYCYKMEDYTHPELLQADLPHWGAVLSDDHWRLVSQRIGWLTFEEIGSAVLENTLLPAEAEAAFGRFMADRGIRVPAAPAVSQGLPA